MSAKIATANTKTISPKKKIVFDSNLKTIFYLVLPLLLIPPFFRGLFFDFEADLAHIYTALVFAAYIFVRKDRIKVSRNLMDYAWIGLIAAYVISNFVAFNQRAAIEGVLRIFNFFIIYWLLAQTVSSLKDLKNAIGIMYISGLGVALAGLGTAYGTFWFKGAYSEGMILSTLQYHNAAAIFLVAAGIIGLYMAAVLENQWLRIAAGGVNYIILATAYGAGSRGAMLVAPVGFILLIAGMPKQYRFRVFVNFLAVLIPFIITAKQVLTFAVHSEGYYWGWLFLGIAMGCGVQFITERFFTLAGGTRRKIVAGAGIAITILAVALIFTLGSKILPSGIAERLTHLSLEQVNVQERFYFYRDAFALVKDYPVLGVGGGGWNSAYTGYQSLLYYTTEVHSHPMQVWVETGTVGFMFYVLLWIGLLITIYKIMRRVESPEFRALAWTAAVTAVSISMHSVIDFSLSLGAVAILMYASLGLVRGVERIEIEDTGAVPGAVAGAGSGVRTVGGPMVRKVAGSFLVGIFLLVSASFSIAAFKERDAVYAYKSGDVAEAIEGFESARKFDPFNFNYPMYLSSLYNEQAYRQKNIMLTRTAVENAQEAVRLNQKSVQPLWALVEANLYAQMTTEAVAAAEEAQKRVPWRQDGYDNLTRVYISAAQQYMQKGQKESAREVLNRALAVPGLIEAQVARLGPNERRIWGHGPIPSVNEHIKALIDEAGKVLKTL